MRAFIFCFFLISISGLSQNDKSKPRVDTIYVQCGDTPTYHVKYDTVWTNVRSRNEFPKDPNCYYFEGELSEGKPYSGTEHKYDQDGLLLEVRVWKHGIIETKKLK